jgi:hypothetical protein
MAQSALTAPEVESLRFHLGYGQIGVGGYPYTQDGFYELFHGVIEANLTSGEETSATTVIAAGAATITPVSMTGIAVHAQLVVDVGDLAEIVTVKSITVSTFTAVFANAHPASGYPIAVLSGVSRLRMLLHIANKAWGAIQSLDVTTLTAGGLKKVDEIEFHPSGATSTTLSGRLDYYRSILALISSLVRVPVVGEHCGAHVVEQY